MSITPWNANDEGRQRDQLKLIYDYAKFHIGLYLSTPAVLVLVADGFKAKGEPCFFAGLIAALACFVIAGASAGRFLGKHVNDRWDSEYLDNFNKAFTQRQRFLHHTVYWIGVGLGLLGIALSVLLAK